MNRPPAEPPARAEGPIAPARLRFGALLDGWETAAVAALALIAALPLLVVRIPPLQDLPQHIALFRALGSYGDPELGFSRSLSLNLGGSQYLLVPLLGAGLGRLVGVVPAAKVLLAVVVILPPLGLARLLGGLGRPRLWALFLLPLTYNSQLMLGFIPFMLGVGLMFWGWAVALELRLRPGRAGAFVLGAIAVASLYSHVVPFGLLVAGAAALGVGRDGRQTGRRLLPLAPALALGLLGTVRGGGSGASIVGAGFLRRAEMCVHDELPVRLQQLSHWLTDGFTATWDDALLVLWALLLVAVVAGGQRFAISPSKGAGLGVRLAALVPPCAALYFVLPRTCGWIFPIHARFLVLAAFCAPLLLPSLRRAATLPVAAALAAMAIFGSFKATQDFRVARRETGAFERAAAAIPKGSRVATLSFSVGASTIVRPAFLHYAALAQARRGGVVMFSFAVLPHWPVRLRPEVGIPEPSWALQFDPARVDLDKELAWAEYVLVRDGPGPIATHASFEEIFAGDRWRTYRRRR